MITGEPSRTAWGAANYRAAHQLVDPRRIFTDPYAVPVLGADEDAVRAGRQASPEETRMRYFIAIRSRLATDVAEAALARDSQVVVLGAGLDTFALRHPEATVFEVDHPDTQEWKRARLADAGLDVPAGLRFVAVDFEREDLADRLDDAGVDLSRATCFLWLGVVPYLTAAAFAATLSLTGRTQGNEVVFDYAEPIDALDADERRRRTAAMDRVARLGEPWQLFSTPDEIAASLAGAGFDDVDDIGPGDFGPRFLGRPPAPASGRRSGGHVVHARRS